MLSNLGNLGNLASPAQLSDFVPLAQRAVSVEANSMIRFRAAQHTVAGYVRLPYEVLAEQAGSFDITVAAVDFVRWAEQSGPVPAGKDAHWLSPLPPRAGWRRIEVVPDEVVRALVSAGAHLAASADSRQSQESLLASIVLIATPAPGTAPQEPVQVPLGPLSALTRMGFLPRDSQVAVDVSPGWIRVAAALGSTFVGSGSGQLGILSLGG